jgi:hypothetical protein
MLKGRLYFKRRKGRPRMRWLDDVESDLKKMKVKGRNVCMYKGGPKTGPSTATFNDLLCFKRKET